MSASPVGAIAKETIGWSIGVSVLMIIAGMLAIAVPPAAGLAVNIVVAWLLVLSGLAHLVFGWHTRSAGSFLWELLMAILYVGVGCYLFAHPAAGLKTLTLALAIYLFAEGVLELILSRLLRALPGSTWLLLDAVITLVLAILIWYPGSAFKNSGERMNSNPVVAVSGSPNEPAPVPLTPAALLLLNACSIVPQLPLSRV